MSILSSVRDISQKTRIENLHFFPSLSSSSSRSPLPTVSSKKRKIKLPRDDITIESVDLTRENLLTSSSFLSYTKKNIAKLKTIDEMAKEDVIKI